MSQRESTSAREAQGCASALAASKKPQEGTVRPDWNQIRRARLRRYVGSDLGGPCKRSTRWDRIDDCGNDCAIAGCEGARTGEGGVKRTILGGEVVPFCAQLSAHKSSAPVILVVSVCRSAALQQSISITLPMLHSFSPKCSGTPAKVLPASTSKRNKDESRFICIGTLFESVISVNLSNVLRACGRFWTQAFGKSLGNGRAVVSVRFLARRASRSAQFHATTEKSPQARQGQYKDMLRAQSLLCVLDHDAKTEAGENQWFASSEQLTARIPVDQSQEKTRDL